MLNYLIRRSLIALITLVCITFLVFGLIRNMPGSPAALLVGEAMDGRINPADLERANREFGLDKPWYISYGRWLGDVLTGNLGRSFHAKRPVSRVIGERIPGTLLLSVSSLCLTYCLAIPLGLYCSARAGKPDERILSTGLFMLYSLPAFVAALGLMLVFAFKLEWVPLQGMKSDNYNSLTTFGKLKDIAWHAILPVICYSYGTLAYYTRFVRANLQEVIRQDYIRTARAKGAGPLRVLVRHAFRNTLIPLVTMIGLTLPYLLSGSIVLEQIFTWPGMGRLYFESLVTRDYPVIMGLTLIFSVLALFGQLLADMLYAVVDPRVSYS